MPTGVVISAGKMMKTVRVRVAKQVWNSHIRKHFTRHENYMVHDGAEACVEGDVVRIENLFRSSRHKRHVVADIVSPFRTGQERKMIEDVTELLAKKEEKRAAKLDRRAASKGISVEDVRQARSKLEKPGVLEALRRIQELPQMGGEQSRAREEGTLRA